VAGMSQPRTARDLARSRQLFDQWYDQAMDEIWHTCVASGRAQAERALVVSDAFGRPSGEVLRDDPATLTALRAATRSHLSLDVLVRRSGLTGKSSLESAERTAPDRLSARQSGALAAAGEVLDAWRDDTLMP